MLSDSVDTSSINCSLCPVVLNSTLIEEKDIYEAAQNYCGEDCPYI